MSSMRSLVMLGAALAVVGCGTNKPQTDAGIMLPTGGGTAVGMGTGGGSGGGSSGTGGGSAATGGGNTGGSGGGSASVAGTDCAHAIPVPLGTAGVEGVIDVAGKKLFYSFTAQADDALNIATQTTAGAADPLDTSLTLFDATGATKLASVDDSYPRASTDSDMYHRFKTAGTYCVSVEDYSSWSGGTPAARPDAPFTLTVNQLNPAAMWTNPDTEPNDSAAAAQTGKFFVGTSGSIGVIYGGLDSATDIDVFKFNIPVTGQTLSVDLAPLGMPSGPGTNGYGSGMGRFAVRVTKMDGTVIGAWATTASSYATTPEAISVPVPAEDVLVYVERPSGAVPTANDFYFARVDLFEDNTPEASDASNNDMSTPEALTVNVDAEDPKIKNAYLVGHIGSADTDYYSFPVAAGDSVSLLCGALRNGSGLTATYELLTTTGTSLQSETETPTQEIYWSTSSFKSKPPVVATVAGTMLFKVVGAQDATNTANFYRCGIFITSP